jgi:hypothetical protein
MNLEKLLKTHPSYDSNTVQADYLYRSYLGGDKYRAGEYLTHYIGEESGPGDQYRKRLAATPLDNHVQTTVDIYRSFLFREYPERYLGKLADNPLVKDWLSDTDQSGQSMDSFLKSGNDLAMVLGNVWILVDKPSYKVQTQAEAEALGIRAYACVYTPQNVLDWEYKRNIAGKLQLTYIKVREHENDETMTLTCWYPDMVVKYVVSKDSTGKPDEVVGMEQYDNPLGYIPFINHAPVKAPVNGLGQSLVADVADGQKYIYNLLSELEQSIRISGHPSLVKTPSTTASAGAGSIITMQEDMDPGLKPYLLQPTAAGIDSILNTIDKVVEGIQRMTHTAAVQATKGAPMSGVALQTERQLLNAKLSDIADTVQETEIAMWRIWLDWQALNMPEEFEIEYKTTFDLRDQHAELELYRKAIETVPSSAFKRALYTEIAKMTVDEEMLSEVLADIGAANVEVPLESGEA